MVSDDNKPTEKQVADGLIEVMKGRREYSDDLYLLPYQMKAAKMLDVSPHLLVENKIQSSHREIADRQLEFYRSAFPEMAKAGAVFLTNPPYEYESRLHRPFRKPIVRFIVSAKKMMKQFRRARIAIERYNLICTLADTFNRTPDQERLLHLLRSADRRQRKRGMRMTKKWMVLK